MCDPITIAAAVAYATGSKLQYDAAKRASNAEAKAFQELGMDIDRRQNRVAELDKEVGGIVSSLSKLYGRDQGFDQRMQDEAAETEQMAQSLANTSQSALPVAPGESDDLGSALMRDARVVADTKREAQVAQQISAMSNMRSLGDALASISPEMVSGLADISQRQNEQKGQGALSGYDERLYQQRALAARQKANSPIGQALQMAGQMMGMYSMMAPGAAAAGGGTGLTPGATAGFKEVGTAGLQAPASFGYTPQNMFSMVPKY